MMRPDPQTAAAAFERAAAPPTIDRRFITAALMLVMVLASMEMTITATAMPTVIGELHGLDRYAWVASIYLLASTVSMPLYGRLADALGRKKVILSAITLFIAASVLAGSARTMNQLILYRGLQGLGAGGVMPVVLTILGDIFTLKERARMQGAFSAVWGGAALAGPALGAFLVTTLGWRSIFYINLPLGLPGLAILIWKYHDREKPHSTDLDLPGVLSVSTACLALLALVTGLGPDRWPWRAALALLTVAASAFFIRHERRAANPIMPPDLMMSRQIGPPMIASMLLGMGFLSLDTFVPLYVQGGRGGGVTAAASVVTPVMLTWALASFIAAPLLVRWGFRRTALLGSALIIAGFSGLLVCAATAAPHWVLTVVLSLTGMGFGPASMSYLLSAQDSVTYRHRGIITGNIAFFRSLGGALGIGVLGGLFAALIAPGLHHLAARGVTPAAVLQPHVRDQLPPDAIHSAQGVIASGLLWVFAGMLAGALLQGAVTLLMADRKPDHAPRPAEGLESAIV